jgi:D-alanine-D-alanine ligase
LSTSLHVALVYNVKHEETPVASATEAPSTAPRTNNSVAVDAARAALTRDDTYAEWDTEETILAVKSALEQRHRVSLVEADRNAFNVLASLQPDIVFNIAEGLRGPSREAQIPAVLEMLGLPYTGSDPLTLGICLDKSRAKEILAYHGVATPAFHVVESVSDLVGLDLPLPAIVKPLHEGSSKGIMNSSVVRTPQEMEAEVRRVTERYHEPALIEQFLTGREFTVALIGNGDDVRVLPIVEIKFDDLPAGANPIWSFEAKWMWDTLDKPLDVHECPAQLTPELEHKIAELCKRSYRLLRCRDWCRIDVRFDAAGEPHLIELNPLPGILPNPDDHSCFPQAARAAGIDYDRMINMVLDAALVRIGRRNSLPT